MTNAFSELVMIFLPIHFLKGLHIIIIIIIIIIIVEF